MDANDSAPPAMTGEQAIAALGASFDRVHYAFSQYTVAYKAHEALTRGNDTKLPSIILSVPSELAGSDTITVDLNTVPPDNLKAADPMLRLLVNASHRMFFAEWDRHSELFKQISLVMAEYRAGIR